MLEERRGQSPSEEEPGNPAPIDPVPIEMRQEDRERLPISVVAVVMTGVVPMTRRRGIVRRSRRCRLRGFRND